MGLFLDFSGHLNMLICFMTLQGEMWYAGFLNISWEINPSVKEPGGQKTKLRKPNKDRDTNCPRIGWLHSSLISTTRRNCSCKVICCYVFIFKSKDHYSVPIFPLVAFHTIDHSFLKLFGNQVTTQPYFILLPHLLLLLLTWLEFLDL